MSDPYQERPPVETPCDSDVLAGRGNACNYHPGNEYFRALVRKHKRAYVACSKPQKAKFARVIVDAIYFRNGRFLKQDATTKLWHDIGDKKALDKTRQALREGAPDILKEIKPGSDSDDEKAEAERYSSTGKVGTDNAFAVAGIVEAPPASMLHVSMHTPSSTPVIQNRNRIVNYGSRPPPSSFRSMPRPSFGALPAHLVANAQRQTSQEMDALHRKLAALYTPEDFEPTPIHPNLQLSIHENTRLQSTTPGLDNESFQSRLPIRPLQRSDSSDSLDIKKVFANETPKPRGKMDDLSQQLSNMSFSVGDIVAIQEDGNLSALFDESMRARDNGNGKLKSPQYNEDDNVSALFDESMRVKDNGDANLKSSQYNNKSMNMSLGLNDMSMSSLAGESNFAVDLSLGNFVVDSSLGNFAVDSSLGNYGVDSSLGNFMSTTSISRVFDESADKL